MEVQKGQVQKNETAAAVHLILAFVQLTPQDINILWQNWDGTGIGSDGRESQP